MHEGEAVRAPPPHVFFCPLLKIALGNSYLKILDISKLFVGDALMKKNSLSEHFVLRVGKIAVRGLMSVAAGS